MGTVTQCHVCLCKLKLITFVSLEILFVLVFIFLLSCNGSCAYLITLLEFTIKCCLLWPAQSSSTNSYRIDLPWFVCLFLFLLLLFARIGLSLPCLQAHLPVNKKITFKYKPLGLSPPNLVPRVFSSYFRTENPWG